MAIARSSPLLRVSYNTENGQGRDFSLFFIPGGPSEGRFSKGIAMQRLLPRTIQQSSKVVY